MSDLSHLIDEACAWLDGSKTAPLSTFVESLSTAKNSQVSDNTGSFHNFQYFHSENEHPSSDELLELETSVFSAEGSRAKGSCEKIVERMESVERGAKIPAESTSPLFPHSLYEVERVERGTEPERPVFDPNSAAPQSVEPLPIAPADVWAGVERETLSLAGLGLDDDEARRRAVEITAAKIRNSVALAERQAHGAACHVCDEPLDDSLPVVAVLSGKPGRPLHMHAGCCPAYSARRVALVDRIMAAAGYGAEAARSRDDRGRDGAGKRARYGDLLARSVGDG